MFTVSIVIPTYNRPVLLAEAIRSCLQQTYPPSELIIGDDSPGEESRRVVEAIQTTTLIPIRHIHNQPSLRQVANVNRLFDAATGDKTMLLHDDDMLLPDALETLIDVFQQHETVSVAYGKQYLIDQTGQIDYASSEAFNRDFYRTPLYEGMTMTPFEAGLSQQFPNNGYLIDTAIIRQIQYTNNAGDACDFDFGYQIGVAGYRTYFVDRYLGKYRLHDQSISHNKTSNPAYHAYRLLVAANPETPLGQTIREIRLRERAAVAITEALLMGHRREAMSILVGPWYRGRLLTPRGIKRVLHTLFTRQFERPAQPQAAPAVHCELPVSDSVSL